MHTAIRANTIREHDYVCASRMMARSSFLNEEASALVALTGLLCARGFEFFDARAPQPSSAEISYILLAMHRDHLAPHV